MDGASIQRHCVQRDTYHHEGTCSTRQAQERMTTAASVEISSDGYLLPLSHEGIQFQRMSKAVDFSV